MQIFSALAALFLSIYFMLLLLIMHPNYTRLFTILPFVMYLAAYGMQFFAEFLSKLVEMLLWKRYRCNSRIFFILLVLTAVGFNAYILYAYVQDGVNFGDVVTTTYRLIDKERTNSEKKVFTFC